MMCGFLIPSIAYTAKRSLCLCEKPHTAQREINRVLINLKKDIIHIVAGFDSF